MSRKLIIGGAYFYDKKNERAIARKAVHLRRKHDLCKCSSDARRYASKQQADEDARPAATCDECGKVKLIVGVLVVFADEAEVGRES